MFRFDAKTGYFLYPESFGAGDTEFRMNSGLTYENNVTPREDIRVIKHGLQVPTGMSSYASFVAEMKESEKVFQKVLIKNS